MHVPSWRAPVLGLTLLAIAAPSRARGQEPAPRPRPNVLLAISDDQSWLHTGAAGDPGVATPAFDRIAREGVRFELAFVAAPSCTPSRGALLTGQAMWRLREGGVLHGSLPPDLPVYPRLLEQAGWFVGFTGKGWGPGDLGATGRAERPEGRAFQANKLGEAPQGVSRNDYAANFEAFLDARPDGAPFCFWYGASEPHRPYGAAGADADADPGAVPRRPACLPDAPEVARDLAAYAREIEHFDAHLARMLAALEARGELADTIVVVTSDNGMPFPRAKANVYDAGARVPLAVAWPAAVPGGRVVEDPVSLCDLAPTFLEAAGLAPPPAMTGRSLLPILRAEQGGRVDPAREHVLIGLEQHVPARAGFVGYPVRALRTQRFLLVANLEPERWPAGDPPPFEITPGRAYADIDDGPTKRYLLAHAEDPAVAPLFALAVARRPRFELYDVARDPDQLTDVAADPRYSGELEALTRTLFRALRSAGDPRAEGRAPWERYPVHAGYLAGHEAFAESRAR